MTIAEDVSLGAVIFWVAVAVVILLGIRKVWPALKKFVALVDVLGDLPATLTEVKATQKEHTVALGAIRHEVEMNSGGSVKDAVVRTENGVKSLKKDLDTHIEFCKQRELLLERKEKEE